MNVLVLLPVQARHRTQLEGAVPGARLTYASAQSVTNEQIETAEVIIGNLDPERLPRARCLRLLQLNSAGYDNYVAAGTLPAQASLAARFTSSIPVSGLPQRIFSSTLSENRKQSWET